MLLVPEGGFACIKCSRVGLAVSFLATVGASHGCSVCSLFRITSIRRVAFECAWHKISLSGKLSLVACTLCVLSNTCTRRESLPITQQHAVDASLKQITVELWFRSALSFLGLPCTRCLSLFRLSYSIPSGGSGPTLVAEGRSSQRSIS